MGWAHHQSFSAYSKTDLPFSRFVLRGAWSLGGSLHEQSFLGTVFVEPGGGRRVARNEGIHHLFLRGYTEDISIRTIMNSQSLENFCRHCHMTWNDGERLGVSIPSAGRTARGLLPDEHPQMVLQWEMFYTTHFWSKLVYCWVEPIKRDRVLFEGGDAKVQVFWSVPVNNCTFFWIKRQKREMQIIQPFHIPATLVGGVFRKIFALQSAIRGSILNVKPAWVNRETGDWTSNLEVPYLVAHPQSISGL